MDRVFSMKDRVLREIQDLLALSRRPPKYRKIMFKKEYEYTLSGCIENLD